MTRQWIATLAALWLASIASAVLLIHHISLQEAAAVQPLNTTSVETYPTQEADEPVVDTPAVLEMPAVTIVAPRLGVAEMQGAGSAWRTDDLIIGPGIVTHPVTIKR